MNDDEIQSFDPEQSLSAMQLVDDLLTERKDELYNIHAGKGLLKTKIEKFSKVQEVANAFSNTNSKEKKTKHKTKQNHHLLEFEFFLLR